MRRGDRALQGGFTMLVVLAALFILALGSQQVMAVASQQATREREALLQRVGEAYRSAIRSYYESSPGGVKQWPRALDDLLEDRRFVGTHRHLRELYSDPMVRAGTWGVVREPGGGITGVHSLSAGEPIRVVRDAQGVPARTYADWRFVYEPPGVVGVR
ncbi:MAG: type II secretion system protein [Burkholderiales bacterium]|nr:type II secretion system protein [Burkholderiales bacterium]